MMPATLPPRAASIAGYAVVTNRSPVLITSERRKNTMLSPSVLADGAWMMTTGSSLKKIFRCAEEYVFVGHAITGYGDAPLLMRGSTFSWPITFTPGPVTIPGVHK